MNIRLSHINFIAGLLFTVALLLLICGAVGLDFNVLWAAWAVLFIWCCLYVQTAYRRVSGAVLLLLGLWMVLGFPDRIFMHWSAHVPFYLKSLHGFSSVTARMFQMNQWSDFLSYCTEVVVQGQNRISTSTAYDLSMILMLVVVVSLTTYRLLLKRTHYSVFMVPILLFIHQWFHYAAHMQSIFALYFIAFVLIAGDYMQEVSQRQAKAEKIGSAYFKMHSYGVYLMGVSLVVLMTSRILLVAIPIERLNQALGEHVPNVTDMRTGYKRESMNIFTFDQTVYQPFEKLGGPVDLSKNPVLLRVWSEKPGLYLRGRVLTNYSGSAWSSDHTSYRNMGSYMSSGGVVETVTIIPEGIYTLTIFAPLGVVDVELELSKVYTNPDGIMYYKRASLEGALDVYTVQVSGKSSALIDHEIYLQLPEVYDREVVDRAIGLTQGLSTDYEKMDALQTYLRSNFKYDLKPSILPDDAEFVSYFLKEEKGGYCTYFASALATMGRAVGVPTRYVEGFVLPAQREEDGAYAVRADRAHAWVEAYIDGRGWMPFEGTPAYAASRPIAAEAKSDDPEKLSARAVQDLDVVLSAKEGLLEEAFGDYAPDLEMESTETGAVVSILLVVLMCSVLYMAVLYMRVKRYFETASDRRRAVRWVYYMESLLDASMEDVPVSSSPAEKLALYFESHQDDRRVQAHLFKDNAAGLKSYDIINWIETALYSDRIFEQVEVRRIEGFVKRLERVMGRRRHRYTYFSSQTRPLKSKWKVAE